MDSTWFQCHKIVTDERLQKLKKVKITAATTMFWRPQKGKPETCLATIEAIYHFFKQYATAFECQPYDGRYDNLLFWFVHFHNLIQKEYKAKVHLKKNDGLILNKLGFIKYDGDEDGAEAGAEGAGGGGGARVAATAGEGVGVGRGGRGAQVMQGWECPLQGLVQSKNFY